MLRKTDAGQAHFNPQATKGVVSTPYAFLNHTLVAYGINLIIFGSCWGSIWTHLELKFVLVAQTIKKLYL